MKKLSGIFAVSMIAIMTAGAARADIAATSYVDTEVGKRVKIDQGTANASKAVVTDAKGQVTVGTVEKGMLAEGVQTSLDKADTALQAADIAGKVDVDQTAANKDKAVITDATGQITTGQIVSGMIEDGAVTTGKIADKNVTKAKLADDVQTSLDKADSALQAADIAGKVDVDQTVANKDKAVITDATGQITTGQIVSGMIEDGAVTTTKITDANVTAAKLAADAVTTGKIADKNVTKAKLADDVQTSLGLADSAIQASDVATKEKVGVVKIGDNITVDANGTISVAADTDTTYTAGTNVEIDANNNNAINVAGTTEVAQNGTGLLTSGGAYTALSGKQDKLTTDETIAQLAQGTSDATKVGNYALTLKVAEGGAKTLVWEYIGR